MHKHNNFCLAPARRVEWNLVEVFDDNVVLLGGEALAVIPACMERKRVTGSDAMNIDTVGEAAWLGSGPPACQQVYAISR